MATAARKLVPVEEPPENSFAQLWERLGKVPLDRILATPAPGTATEKDCIRYLEAANKRLVELVDGTLVEKPLGTKEALIASVVLHQVMTFLDEQDLGIAIGADGAMRLMRGLVRVPDISFIGWGKLPDGIPDEPIFGLVPDLAVEVISVSNTKGEMERRLRDYFRTGVSLVWFIRPKTETAEVYHAPKRMKRVAKDGTLDGEEVLPGFSLSLKILFERVKRRPRKK